MGRVSRYKKIKACDPFSKQNAGRANQDRVAVWGLGDDGRKAKKRSRKAEKLRAQNKRKRRRQEQEGDSSNQFDAPPVDGDDFDLSDLTGSIRKEKKPKLQQQLEEQHETTFTAGKLETIESAKKAIQEDRKLHRMLKIDEEIESKRLQELVKEHRRKESEGYRDYKRRMHNATQTAIVKTQQQHQHLKNPERAEKKKEFLKNKKNQKKKGKRSAAAAADYMVGQQRSDNQYDDDDEQDIDLTSRKVDPVRFGEQVERPPTLRQLPRGAKGKAQQQQQQQQQSEMSANKKAKNTMTPEDERAEQNAMEQMRLKVQAQYKVIRRQRNGGFHL